MGSPTLTYTLTNNTTADASQVMQNFNDLLNGSTDGTKDLSINALTVAGNLTATGTTNTIGNSTTDDLVIGASLASTLNIKTTNTYDIGSSTLGLRALYLGANSQTTKVVGNAAMSATYTMSLPAALGAADDYVVRSTTSGVLSFQKPGPITATGSDADTTLTITSSRHQVVVPTANRNYTLPTTGIIAGDIFYFSNNAAVSANSFSVIVKASGGTTVRTVYPQTTGHVMALQDTPTTSAHWISLDEITSNWSPYTPAVAGLGTTTNSVFVWRRRGANLEIEGKITGGTPSGSLNIQIPLPTVPAAMNIDTTNFSTTAVTSYGAWNALNTGGTTPLYSTSGRLVYTSVIGTASLLLCYNGNSSVYLPEVGSAIFGSNVQLDFHSISMPISGWTSRRG